MSLQMDVAGPISAAHVPAARRGAPHLSVIGVTRVVRLLAPQQLLPPASRVVAALPQRVAGPLASGAALALAEGPLAGLREPARHHLRPTNASQSSSVLGNASHRGAQAPPPVGARLAWCCPACMRCGGAPGQLFGERCSAGGKYGREGRTMAAWSRLWPPRDMAGRGRVGATARHA